MTPDRIKLMSLLLAISTLYIELQNDTAAAGTYEIVAAGEVEIPETISEYMGVLNYAITCRLIEGIAALFDSESFKGQENCSLKLLKKLCLADKECFPQAEKEMPIILIDEAISDYDKLEIKYARNKQLSHHDFNQIVNGKHVQICYEDEEALVMKIEKIIMSVLNRYNRIIKPPFINIGTKKEEYKNALREICKQ